MPESRIGLTFELYLDGIPEPSDTGQNMPHVHCWAWRADLNEWRCADVTCGMFPRYRPGQPHPADAGMDDEPGYGAGV